MRNYKRILIFGQTFNDCSGGGITLSNLFKGWTKDKIAVVSTGHMFNNVTSDICNTYYQLGKEEQMWKFPFNLIQRSFPSGLISFNTKNDSKITIKKTGIRDFFINKFFFPFLQFAGLFHCLSKIHLSKRLKIWLSVFQPEILYLQVSTREAVLFASDLIDYLRIPSVIHMMDDWPSTISSMGPLKEYWRRRIDEELKQLFNKVDLHLSISNSMSSEYRKRYQKDFHVFHNPVEVDNWRPYIKNNFKINRDHIQILYSGRIGTGITQSLIEIAEAVDSMNTLDNNGYLVKLYIQSPTISREITTKLQKHKCVVINQVVNYSKLPEIFSQADILIIANDFTKKGIKFLRYSMPTKVSEYMISGTPIMAYSDSSSAVSNFLSENKCGLVVTEHNKNKIIAAIIYLLDNEGYRKTLSKNAVSLAVELFSIDKVQRQFQQLLIGLASSS